MDWLLDPLSVVTLKLAICLCGGFIVGFYFGMLYEDDGQR